jgi:hypothetical protein
MIVVRKKERKIVETRLLLLLLLDVVNCILIPHTSHSASPFVLTAAACLAGVVWLVSLARAWKDHVCNPVPPANRESSRHLS